MEQCKTLNRPFHGSFKFSHEPISDSADTAEKEGLKKDNCQVWELFVEKKTEDIAWQGRNIPSVQNDACMVGGGGERGGGGGRKHQLAPHHKNVCEISRLWTYYFQNWQLY